MLSLYLKELLCVLHPPLAEMEEDVSEEMEKIREKLCVVVDVSSSSSLDSCLSSSQVVELPNGTRLVVGGRERALCGEALFRPTLLGGVYLHSSLLGVGLHEAVYNSIFKCDVDIRRDLAANIVLSGGLSLTEVSFVC